MAEYDPIVALGAAREVVAQQSSRAVSQAVMNIAGESALTLVAQIDIEQERYAAEARRAEAARLEARKVELEGRANAALLVDVAHGIRDRIGLRFEGLTTESYEHWLAQRTRTVFARPPRGSSFGHTEYSKTSYPDYAMNSWSIGQRPIPLWIIGHQQDKNTNRYIALAPYCAGMRICINGEGAILGGPNDSLALYRVDTKRKEPLVPAPSLPTDDEVRAAYNPSGGTFRFEQVRLATSRAMPR